MIKYFICLIVILACTNLHAQNIQDFKTKNSANQKERTAMLDLLRAKMKKSLKIECSYVVEHFKVSSNYAWMKGTAQRKDGKPLELNPDLDLDCCKVTCLFKKVHGSWQIEEEGYFGTDVWYIGIGNRYPDAPQGIFPSYEIYYNGN